LELLLVSVFPLLCLFEFAVFALADLREQGVCIKFCFELGKTTAQTHQMLNQAFGDNRLSATKQQRCLMQ
jgi:hypothetical protein